MNVVKRTTLIVRDMDVAKQWYQQVLQLDVWMDDMVTLSGVGLAAGKAGDKTHLVILKCEDPVIGMIGLLQWVDPVLPAPPVPTAVTYGMPTFVVAADDVNGVHQRAVALDSHIHAAPHEWSIRGQNGKMKHFLGLSLFDPDGHFYECNQLVSETDE